MNKGLAIQNMYPNADPVLDYRVQDDGAGQYVALWNIKDATGAVVPQPSDADLLSAYLNVQKQLKTASLSKQCNQAIVGGFTSSALGVAHTYPSDAQAQGNLHMSLKRFEDPAITSISFKTLDAGYLAHTKDQLTKVFHDGFDFGQSQITKLNQLKANVQAATTEAAVDSIAW